MKFLSTYINFSDSHFSYEVALIQGTSIKQSDGVKWNPLEVTIRL